MRGRADCYSALNLHRWKVPPGPHQAQDNMCNPRDSELTVLTRLRCYARSAAPWKLMFAPRDISQSALGDSGQRDGAC